MTPQFKSTLGYSTRIKSHKVSKKNSEPERVLRKRLHRLESHRVLENLLVESISDIQFLFTMASSVNPATNPLSPMDGFFLPLNFTNIVGHPHSIPDKSIEKLPTF